MQILAYILRFGLAEFRLTCPFSLDMKQAPIAHVHDLAWQWLGADQK